jgi:hypothetical protein
VIVLWRFTAHAVFMPSSAPKTTSEGTPRIVEVMGATLTVDKYEMALSRVSTTTGRFCPAGKIGRELFGRPSCLPLPGKSFLNYLRVSGISGSVALLFGERF